MLLAVRISTYGCTWESDFGQHSRSKSCSPLRHEQLLRERVLSKLPACTLKHEPIVKHKTTKYPISVISFMLSLGFLVYCFRIDMSAVQGQSSRLSVILRGTQSSRLVQCFSSHPEELQASLNTENHIKIALFE